MGVSGGYPKTKSKYLSVQYLLISKKLAPKVKPFKNFIFEGAIWGGLRGEYPQTMSKFLSLNYLLISKNTGTLN